jgi:hypothetical protein
VEERPRSRSDIQVFLPSSFLLFLPPFPNPLVAESPILSYVFAFHVTLSSFAFYVPLQLYLPSGDTSTGERAEKEGQAGKRERRSGRRERSQCQQRQQRQLGGEHGFDVGTAAL